MEARNAAGRRVSLLNDESSSYGTALHHYQQQPQHSLAFQQAGGHAPSHSYRSPSSSSSSPNTPELLRSDSYDSQMSHDPISPLTPTVDYTYSRASLYNGEYTKRPAYVDSSRSTSYEDNETVGSSTSIPEPLAERSGERPGKRYPCRFREINGCEKTFTTSGHASRHSKIHTAEKAVQCTYPGCSKKFTRADNMKQHLETHFKDKSRSSASQRAQKVALAEARRNSSASRSRSSTSTATTTSESSDTARDAMQWESDAYLTSAPGLASPSTSSWDMHTRTLPLLTRPSAARSPSSGLDALAMVVACQEGGGR